MFNNHLNNELLRKKGTVLLMNFYNKKEIKKQELRTRKIYLMMMCMWIHIISEC